MQDDRKYASRFSAKPTGGLCAVLPYIPLHFRKGMYPLSALITKDNNVLTLRLEPCDILYYVVPLLDKTEDFQFIVSEYD